jgi:hypothetical protein
LRPERGPPDKAHILQSDLDPSRLANVALQAAAPLALKLGPHDRREAPAVL